MSAPSQAPSRRLARSARPTEAALVFAVAGTALTALYAYATSRLPLPDFFPSAGVSLDFIKMLGPGRRTPAEDYVALATLSIALYAAVVWAAWHHAAQLPRLSRVLLVGFPVLFAAALLFMYPPTAVDLFHYHADARTLWLYGRNPLVVSPAQSGYPIGISWADQPSPYGPAWQLITAPLAPLIWFGDHLVATLVGLKLIGAASVFVCGWAIVRVVRMSRPGWEWVAWVLFAWNPFVLMRAVANGHNDLVMMGFALFALERAQRRDLTLAIALLALSMLVKFTTALLAPPLLVYAWFQIEGDARTRVRRLAPGVALAAGTIIVAYVPFWAGLHTFDGVRNQASIFITSVPDVIRSLLWNHIGVARASTVTLDGTRAAFVLIAIPVTWRARRSFDHLLVACFTLMLLYLVIAAAWFRPWYMLWPAVLIAMRPNRWGIALFLAITLANLFPDLVEQYRYDWGLSAPFVARAAPLVPQFVPVMAVWLVAWWWHRGWDLGASRAPAVAGGSGASAAAAAGSGPVPGRGDR